MKKLIIVLSILLFNVSVFGQKQKTFMDSCRDARLVAKSWLKAWDAGDTETMKKLSSKGTTLCDLKYITQVHFNEEDMTKWGEAKYWAVKRDTVGNKIIGLLITPSFEGENAGSLPLFLHQQDGKWVINLYYSNFCLCESPCDGDVIIKIIKN